MSEEEFEPRNVSTQHAQQVLQLLDHEYVAGAKKPAKGGGGRSPGAEAKKVVKKKVSTKGAASPDSGDGDEAGKNRLKKKAVHKANQDTFRGKYYVHVHVLHQRAVCGWLGGGKHNDVKQGLLQRLSEMASPQKYLLKQNSAN